MKLRSISAKIILLQVALLALALGLSAAAALAFMSRYLQDSALESTRDTARLVENLIQRDIQQAALFSRLIAEDYQVKVALEGMSQGAPLDEQDLRAHLNAELHSLSADFLSVAGADGVVFVHEDRVSVERADRAVLDHEPLFLSRVFQQSEAARRQAVGVEPVYPRTMAVVAMAPVTGENGRVLGFVRLGYRLDQRFITQVRDITRTDVAVRRRGVFLASTLKTQPRGSASNTAMKRDYLVHVSSISNGEQTAAELITALPKSPIHTIMRNTILVVIAVGLSVFALAVLAGARLARVMVKPLDRLMQGVQQLESGDLSTHIPPQGGDEIGRLSESFNLMTGSLRARDEEIRHNQEQLIESGKLAAVGELAAGVAHEIGNPLAAISGYIQLLKGITQDGKAQHFLQEMQKEAGFIDATIRELLDFARPSRTEDECVSLNDIVEEALRMLSFHKAMRDVTVNREPDASAPEVLGSRKELLQAVLNLTLNAAQAMPGGGEIRIRIVGSGEDIPEGRAAIIVTDTGPGVPPAEAGKIFDPFYTTKRGGTGLGLSITYRIVQRHQGEIQVVSKPGSGATFRMLLPIVKNPRHR